MVPTVPLVSTVPLPRRPRDPDDTARRWYEDELGWATTPGEPFRLVTGLRFDVLEVPAEAGYAALRHLGPASPVAMHGGRMRLLVAAGGADELPGLLDWLEWGAVALDLRAIGAGGHIEAPPPPDRTGSSRRIGSADRIASPDPTGSQGAAVWLRPPEPGCESELLLPTLSAVGGVGGAPDLVRLVDTMATECHRVRLRRACAQPLAFS
ncbi:SCO3374 family protein [Streptomyces glomeratus]|uniref:SCO3374 family protein n=1 Tax=Streptomyces glomeratus TaxID=284452 RepID=A0ABP6LCK9_9ACTN|nr:SCO3374 family protein [Streptomyces glomeratus]MCF1506449.1 SCO3374 family protein [Streptomyces glomeratus]